jgi:hypothetical protein
MSDITLTIKAVVSKGGFDQIFSSGATAIDQAAIGAHSPVLSIGTTEEVISKGDVSSQGLCCLKNLDATNYVDFGPESAGALVSLIRLLPGESAAFRLLPAVVWRAQANTAPCKVQMLLLEA